MQCQFSFRFVNLDNYEFGGWSLGLFAVLSRNSRVLLAVAGFRSHSSVSISISVWQYEVVYASDCPAISDDSKPSTLG